MVHGEFGVEQTALKAPPMRLSSAAIKSAVINTEEDAKSYSPSIHMDCGAFSQEWIFPTHNAMCNVNPMIKKWLCSEAKLDDGNPMVFHIYFKLNILWPRWFHVLLLSFTEVHIIVKWEIVFVADLYSDTMFECFSIGVSSAHQGHICLKKREKKNPVLMAIFAPHISPHTHTHT